MWEQSPLGPQWNVNTEHYLIMYLISGQGLAWFKPFQILTARKVKGLGMVICEKAWYKCTWCKEFKWNYIFSIRIHIQLEKTHRIGSGKAKLPFVQSWKNSFIIHNGLLWQLAKTKIGCLIMDTTLCLCYLYGHLLKLEKMAWYLEWLNEKGWIWEMNCDAGEGVTCKLL